MSFRFVIALSALGLGSCVFATTPCGTRVAFATTVDQGAFECTTAAGDTVKGGVTGSHAEVTAVVNALTTAFQAGAKAAMPIP